MANEDARQVFTRIYEENHWKSSASVSGPGSSLHVTALLRTGLHRTFSELKLRSLVDAPCGDMTWMKAIDYPFERYVGVDIVPKLIEELRQQTWPAHFEFLCADIIVDMLPSADAIFCRDCLVHLPYEAIGKAFAQWKEAGFRYLLTTTFPEHENRNSGLGGWRPLNLQAPPFSWPAPLSIIRERAPNPQDPNNDKSIGIWELSAVPAAFGTPATTASVAVHPVPSGPAVAVSAERPKPVVDPARRAKLIEERRYEEACQLQEAAIAVDPGNAHLHHQMAWLMSARRKLLDAMKFELAAIDLAPDEPSYLRALSRFATVMANGLEQQGRTSIDRDQTAQTQEIRKQVLSAAVAAAEGSRYLDKREVLGAAGAVLQHHHLDAAGTWAEMSTPRRGPGELTVFEGIGRFKFDRTGGPLQTRLLRGLASDLPFIALLCELSERTEADALALDVGAQIGLYTLAMSRYLRGQVLAFESVAANYRALREHLEINDIGNVIAVPKRCGRTQQPPAGENGDGAVTTIDDELRTYDRPVALMRLDLGGASSAALLGAAGTIRLHRPVIVCRLPPNAVEPVTKLTQSMGYRTQRFSGPNWMFTAR